MYIDARNAQGQGTSLVVNLRCPICRQRGTFGAAPSHDLVIWEAGGSYIVGLRRCPDPHCSALIFFVYKNDQLVLTYPAERIDFDPTNVPAAVLASLEEAITCHANQCFVACAIMVRKTLDLLCRDRGAEGSDLKKRVAALGTKVVLPAELLEGLDDLRLLGNDAAHVESKEYDQVGKDEVEVGIEFTKEVLKAVYQYSALLNRLRGLKKVS